MPQLYRLDIVVREEDFPLAEALVAQNAASGWEEESLPTGDMLLRVTSESEEERETVERAISAMLPGATMRGEIIPDKDWLAGWRSYFTPVKAGDFLILPPWMKDTPTEGRLPIIIEPKSAFGTGHHPTTTMCLEAMSVLHSAGVLKAGQRFLDMGTGTGILGIGCVKFGLSGFGADIDPLSISNARENCEMNGVGGEFEIQEGSVELVQGQRFDAVIANILAGPLKEMAPSLMPLVKPGGCLILSGFLSVQVPGMVEAYASMGTAGELRMPSPASDPTRSASQENPEADDWVCLYWPRVQDA
ncbi:50S ribosomal protein L11 methyltransferase [Mailhella sp.]|uniref:50S ribosomal protein L11 methyltransferase n=1 Tax=Mailhella sp. TaxID=1981029 RepID=UPI003AB27A9C